MKFRNLADSIFYGYVTVFLIKTKHDQIGNTTLHQRDGLLR
jgi:hypothetical protein